MAVINTPEPKPLTCLDIEIAVAKNFNYRQNLIVPNVFWGLGFNHELDVAVMTPARYLTEIEIKTTASDLRRDLKKDHHHASPKIRRHFFAVPESLQELALELAPPGWGVLSYREHYMVQVRAATSNPRARPLTEAEAVHLYGLAAMRIWTLKQTLAQRINREFARAHSFERIH